MYKSLFDRAARSTGIRIGIELIPAFFWAIRIGKVQYISTNSVIGCVILLN